jgi:large subunit ribosomal protein L5
MQLPVERPRGAPAGRRRRLARGAGLLALVAAPLLTLLPGTPETELFVTCYPLTRDLSTRIVCHAGTEIETEGMPDAIPDSSPDRQDPGDAPTSVRDRRPGRAIWLDKDHQNEEWSPELQQEREKILTKKLKKLKGKFTPYGPKPWDPPAFRKVAITVILDPKEASNKKILNQCLEELRRITGGMPEVIKAKKNIAWNNQRKGFPCGVGITLNGKLMMDFLTRLNTIVLPRVRDFEGLWPNAFSNTGDYTMQINNQEPFKELDELLDIREVSHPFTINICNNRFTQPAAKELMEKFGFPFTDELKTKRKKDDDVPQWEKEKMKEIGDPRKR